MVWAGREAVHLRGVPGEEPDWEWDPDPLHWGADEYEVVVERRPRSPAATTCFSTTVLGRAGC